MVNKEGIQSSHVTDSTKLSCPYCGGVEIMLSSLMDDPNDIVNDTRFAALDFTMGAGVDITGFVGLCSQCGHEWVPIWYVCDTFAFNGAKVAVGTNLDCGTANSLEDLYLMIMIGTDKGKYVEIDTHTAASPTTITTKYNINTDADGYAMVTNIEPVGWTKITA